MSGEGEPEVGKELTTKNQPSSLVISEDVVDNYMQTSQMLTDKFKEWLIPEVEYTTKIFRQKGKPSLLDPGASKLIGFFQCRPRHKLLERFYDKDEEGYEHIRYVVACELVQESTGKVVAEGVGSCSSDEVKYKYRWYFSSELKRMGMSKDEIHALPEREIQTSRGKAKQYRARNPEIPDLDNTIFKMSAKRAAVDATLQLPGVAAVFTQDVGDYKKPEVASSKKEAPKTVASEQHPPEGVPSFKNGTGVVIQSITPKSIVDFLAQNCEVLDRAHFDIKDSGPAYELRTTKFIPYWKDVNELVKSIGGQYMEYSDKKLNHWRIVKADEQPPQEQPSKREAKPSSTDEVIEGILSFRPNLTRESVQRLIDEERAKAAGLLTEEAAAHLVASNLGLQKDASPPSQSVSSIEELEDILKRRIDGLDDLVDVTQDGKGFSIEPRKALDSEIVETISYIVEGLGGTYEERQTGVGYEWLIGYVAGQQKFR